MFKFISLRSGSSGNCYYLFTETDGLIIDSGIGLRTIKKTFREYGLRLDQIHNMVVTHDHSDHVKASGAVSMAFGIPVYATQLVHDGIKRNYCIKKKIPASQQRIVTKGQTTQIGDFTVTPFAVPHDSMDNVCYKIEYGGVVFALITDVGHVTEEIARLINSADYLVIEANHEIEMLDAGPYPQHLKERIKSPTGHLSNDDCAKAIADNRSERLKHIWLCHLSGENNTPERAAETVGSILASRGVKLGEDFKMDVLSRRFPCGIFDLLPERDNIDTQTVTK